MGCLCCKKSDNRYSVTDYNDMFVTEIKITPANEIKPFGTLKVETNTRFDESNYVSVIINYCPYCGESLNNHRED